MSDIIQWLSTLPVGVLYLAMTVVAAVENVFPPIPADTVVALGSWLAARGKGSALWAFLGVWVGNVAGAAGMYAIGRSHGAAWMHRHFPALASPVNERRLAALYGKYGVGALVLSRFIPGVRALVPPFAGAMRVAPLPAIGAMAIASGIWYGGVSYIAFHAGSEWATLQRLITRSGTIVAIVAAALLAIGASIWFLRRRRAPA